MARPMATMAGRVLDVPPHWDPTRSISSNIELASRAPASEEDERSETSRMGVVAVDHHVERFRPPLLKAT